MSFSRSVKPILSLIFVFGLTACNSTPESIQLEQSLNLVSYQQVAANAEQLKGSTVRWGGVIANVENQPEATLLEMVHFPTKNNGRPVIGEQSVGRFRVYVNGFMDPMVFKAGRSITFVGEVNGTEPGKIGERDYVFPSVNASSYHLWKEYRHIDVTRVDIWPLHHGYFGWGWPYPRSIIYRRKHHHSHNKQSASSDAHQKNVPSAPNKHESRASNNRNMDRKEF